MKSSQEMYTVSLSLFYKSGVPDTLFCPHPINRTAMVMVGKACKHTCMQRTDAYIHGCRNECKSCKVVV